MKVIAINQRFYQIIGMCQRAGKLISGSYAVENSIRQHKVQLVIVSEEASVNTLNKFSDMCKREGVDIIITGKKEWLGRSIGKASRTVLAVTDSAFRNMILNVLNASKANMGVNQECQK